MNQILYMNDDKKKGGPLEIKVVLRIFAILCILFGILLIVQASYALITDKKLSSNDPLVEINMQGTKLQLKVKHDKIIDKIIYSWNNEQQETILQGKGRNELKEEIQLPVGINVLKLKVTDIDGKTVSYSNEYIRPEGDVTLPEIELLVDGSKVKIVVKDETELDYILYRWNNEDDTRVETREESPKQIEEKISILKGENTLTIVAVDKAGNEAIKEQIFKGATKPKIDLLASGKELIIKVTDEEEIKKIEYTLNGVFYSTDPNNEGTSLNTNSFQYNQALADGENIITIKAYNINDLVEEITGTVTI